MIDDDPTVPETDLKTATVDHLIDLAFDGDQAAAAELDRRGVVPEALEPSDDVIASEPVTAERDKALALVAEHCIGRAVLGVEINPGCNAAITLEGGAAIVFTPDGAMAVMEPRGATGRSAA